MLRHANAFFLANIARIVDVTLLREGDDEDDYYVDVPASRLHEVTLRIADLKLTVLERFDAEINAMAIAVPG